MTCLQGAYNLVGKICSIIIVFVTINVHITELYILFSLGASRRPHGGRKTYAETSRIINVKRIVNVKG